VWCHLSVFLKPNGKGKMSKRDVTNEQSIFVLELRELGYLPEAVNSWATLMGASFGPDEQLMTIEEMVAKFSLDHLNPAPARVNFEKLDDFNGKWIRRLSVDDLATRLKPFFEKAGLAPDDATLRRLAPLIQERLVTLDDAVPFAGFFFRPDLQPTPSDLVAKGLTPAQSLAALSRTHALIANASEFTHAALETPLRALAEELNLKPGQIFGIVRVAVTTQTVSPPLFECMEILGRDVVLARLKQAEGMLEAM
jgi:glutamyl-tRNA synthetase